MTRLERAVAILQEEWDCVVILMSRYDSKNRETISETHKFGNAFATEKMIEDANAATIFIDDDEEEDQWQDQR